MRTGSWRGEAPRPSGARAPALLLSHPCRAFMPTPSARVAHPVAPDACAVHDPTANAG